MFKGYTFGITNGIVTMISLIVGLYSTNVNKIGIIGAIIAMLISDPLADAYAIYDAEHERSPQNAYKSFISAFSSQVFMQLIILLIVIISPDTITAIYTSVIIGFITIIGWGIYNKKNYDDIAKNLFIISFIIAITYWIDKSVYLNYK